MTPIQKRAYFVIGLYRSIHGYAPTVREVALGIDRSIGATHNILRALREEGHVDWEPTRVRTLRVAS